MRKKTLQELTIIDNFMFGAVMMIPENCKRFLELALGIEISRGTIIVRLIWNCCWLELHMKNCRIRM